MIEHNTLKKIPHFDCHYDHYSELIENFLSEKRLWGLVEIDVEKPTKGTILMEVQQTELDYVRIKDYQVKHYLFQAIHRTFFEQILYHPTSKIVRDTMKQKFGGNSKVKTSLLNSLRREFEVLEVMMVYKRMTSNG